MVISGRLLTVRSFYKKVKMSQQKLQFRFSQCKDEVKSENSSQVQPNNSSQPKESNVSQHGSAEIPDGPDGLDVSKFVSKWAPLLKLNLSQNYQQTPENSQTDSRKNVENPTSRFPTEINRIEILADLGMSLEQ